MAVSQQWTFRQLGGKRKTLTLTGRAAPFGRPRQGSVVRNPVRVRQQETYYPGNELPTRHIFGVRREPLEIHGRFTDQDLGYDGAKKMAQTVLAFTQEAQPVSVSWGDIVGVTGLIEIFDPGWEAEHEVEWKMRILVDEDTLTSSASAPIQVSSKKTLVDLSEKLQPLVQFRTNPLVDFDLWIAGLFDKLDDYISAVTGACGTLVRLANSIGNIESALASELGRLRAGIGQCKTAILTMSMATDAAVQDALNIKESALNTAGFLWHYNNTQLTLQVALAALAEADLAAEIAERGKAETTTRAKAGDTWEILSIRMYGNPTKADDLRQANGARYGEMPKPGQTIHVPLEI